MTDPVKEFVATLDPEHVLYANYTARAPKTARGFIAKVHVPECGDCTGKGATYRVSEVVVKHPDGEEWEVSFRRPAMEIEVRRGGAFGEGYTTLHPAAHFERNRYSLHPEGLCGPMAGGNWIEPKGELLALIGCNEGHRRDAGKIPIHDRYETWADYNAMT